jgi:hypothetical protein
MNARDYVFEHHNQATTDADWMNQFEMVRSVRLVPGVDAGPIRPPRPASRGARPWSIAFGLAREAMQLSARLLPMLWRNGLRDTGRRVRGHLTGFAQMMAWEVSRWRLQHRVSGHK